MRFASLATRNGRARRLGTLMGCGVLGLGLLTGCETKGFLDPGEMGRYKHTSLSLPILNTVDPGIEEPNAEFVSAVPPAQEDLEVRAADYRISKNDLLNVEISDVQVPGQQTVKQTRVSESGNISLPLVGQVRAEDMTEAELEQAVKEEYRRQNLLPNAQVSVTVVEARGRAFSIMGAVNAPGQYAIFEPDFRILDALIVSREASSPLIEDIYIIRRTDLDRRGGTRPAPAGGGAGTPGTPGVAPTRPGTVPDDLAPRSAAPAAGPAAAPRGTVAARTTPRAPLAAAGARLPGRRGPVVHLAADPGDVAPGATSAPRPLAPAGAPAGGDYAEFEGRRIYVGPGTQPAAAPAVARPAGEAVFAPPPAPATGSPAAGTDVTVGPGATTGDVTVTGGTTSGDMTASGGMAPDGSTMSRRRGQFEFNDLRAPANTKIIRIPLSRLRNGELQFNVVVRPKDIIIVQNLPVGEYYMGGHVARPGAYTLTQRRITLKQAIISANMLDQLAIPERTDIVRRVGRDREIFVRVNLAKIFAGEQSDIYLKPDDQVMVGTNALAPFLAAARGAFRLTYGFGFLYDRNYAAEENNRGFQGR